MSCRIVFMGTPDFAVPCLARLIEDGYDVAGVFSQPDRPKGRGHRLSPPPVKELAMQHNIPVFQPEKMKDGEAESILCTLSPDLAVVVAYGRILPKALLDIPRFGCINVHASLLPKLRGAAPIQWSVINGDAVTGVTTMYMAEGLDTGDILLQKETPIGEEETAGALFDRLSALGAQCLSETIPPILSGTAVQRAQEDALATWAPIITKETARLDFEKSPAEICNLVRGLNPAPVAFAFLNGKQVKVLKAVPVAGFSGAPGKVLEPKELIVGCKGGAVRLCEVRPEGKKAMSGGEFSRGQRLCGGELFTSDSQ